MGTIGVVGAGVMGSEIAWVAARAGLPVVLHDAAAGALVGGVGHVRSLTDREVARGRLAPADGDALVARVLSARDPESLARCDVVIEAVTEVLEVKRAVLRTVDAVLPPEGLIASNTSGLSITELGRATSRPARVLGLHFFNPAARMELVEVVRGADTADATIAEGEALARAVGKTPVRVRECPGFLVNRVLVRAMAEAYRHATAEGAAPAGVDTAVAALAPVPMGPFALGDLIGLDTLEHIRTDLAAAYGDRFADGGALAEQLAAGRRGRKGGGGFVTDEAGAAPAGPAEEAAALRYVLGAVDEARRCVAEEVAARADVDRALRLGAGWRQGPLEWAQARPAGELPRLVASAGPDARRYPAAAGGTVPA